LIDLKDYGDLTIHERNLLKIKNKNTREFIIERLNSTSISKRKKQDILRTLTNNYEDYSLLWNEYCRYGINKIMKLINSY